MEGGMSRVMSIRRISSLGTNRERPVHTVYGAKPDRIEPATATGAITKPLDLGEMLASQPTDAARFHPCEECGKVARGDSPLCEECSAGREEVEDEAPDFAEKEAYARRMSLIRIGITATVMLAALATLFWFNDVRRLIDGLLPHRPDPMQTAVRRDVASSEGLAFPTHAQQVQTPSVVATARGLVAAATVELPDRTGPSATQAVRAQQTPTTAPRAGATESPRSTSSPTLRTAPALTPTLSPAHTPAGERTATRTAGPAGAQPQPATPTGITSPTQYAVIPSHVPATTGVFPTRTPIPTNVAGPTALPGLPTPTAAVVASATPTALITSPTPMATPIRPTISPLPGRTILPEPSLTIPLPTLTVDVTVPPLPTLPAPTLTVAVPTSIPPLPTAPPLPTQPLPVETPPIPTLTVAVPTSIPPLPTAPPAPPTAPPTAPPMPTQPLPTQAPTQPVPTSEPTSVPTSLVPTLPPVPTLTVLPAVTVTIPLP